jgi:glycosyltransferase involved in cell wall biosynthesis
LAQLAFVIPAYNEETLIGTCIESVLAEIKRSGADVEVVVVNNASKDRTGEIARGYPGVKVVDELQKGLVHARHAGFENSTAELVANIDADTKVPEGWITTVLAEFEKTPKLVAMSGPYIYYDLSLWNRFLVRLALLRRRQHAGGDRRQAWHFPPIRPAPRFALGQ